MDQTKFKPFLAIVVLLIILSFSNFLSPNMLEKETVKTNMAEQKESHTKVRIAEGNDVDLKEWLRTKGDILQFALGLREQEGSCLGLTREMEGELFGCETEVVHV